MQGVAQLLVFTTAAGCAMLAVVAGHAGPCQDHSPGRTQPMWCLKKYLPCVTSADCPGELTCACSTVCGPVCRQTETSNRALKRDGQGNAGSCPVLPAPSSAWDMWMPFGCVNVNSCSSDADCDDQHPDSQGSYKCCERLCGKRCVLAVHSS